MATCQATKRDGTACTYRARAGFHTCGIHKNIMIETNLPGQCTAIKTDGVRCSKMCIEDHLVCRFHHSVNIRRQQEINKRMLLERSMSDIILRAVPTFDILENRVRVAYEEGNITEVAHDQLIPLLENLWNWNNRLNAPAVQPRSELQRLALDKQNVHTKVVTDQTTEVEKYLSKTPIPQTQDTLKEIQTLWSKRENFKKVFNDIKRFYKDMIIPDFHYKRLLDGLWATIQVHEHKQELLERLWQETSEAVRMCWQGHISRLCNVMVGFTDEVKAVIPVGELLQNKMAMISQLDAETSEKIRQANEFFDEHEIPQTERQAWIEAF